MAIFKGFFEGLIEDTCGEFTGRFIYENIVKFLLVLVLIMTPFIIAGLACFFLKS